MASTRWVALLLLLILGWPARAELDVLGQYVLGDGMRQITYVVGPESMDSQADDGQALARAGGPRFVASAPSHLAGVGSLQFDGEDDYYGRSGALFTSRQNFVIEAWALAEESDATGLQGVVANGSGAQGYVLGRMNGRWVAFVGSVGAFDLGPVTAGEWTHLAIVNDDGDAAAYLNGQRVRDILLSPAIADQFRIGNAGLPSECFAGLIHSVRVATFEDGGFDPDADLLLDYQTIRRVEAEAVEKRLARVRALREQPGVRTVDALAHPRQARDWLIHNINDRSEVLLQIGEGGETATLMLTNGLVSRSFYIGENLACTGYRNLSNQAEYIRAVKPEARVQLDGTWYAVGGLTGQPERSYLLAQWIPDMKADPHAFRFEGITVGAPVERYPWQRKFNAVDTPWPPAGVRVTMHYSAPAGIDPQHRGVAIDVHYELYDGIPVMSKSFTVHNNAGDTVMIDAFESELLAMPQDQIRRIHAESDYSFHLANHGPLDVHASGAHSAAIDYSAPPHLAGDTTTQWRVDPEYDMFGHHAAIEDKFLGHPFRNLMLSMPPIGPGRPIEPGTAFESFSTFELLQDSDDIERRSLGVRRMYRKIAPQVTEHLLTASTPSHDPAVLLPLLDQMYEIGFEHLNIAFWPGIAHDNLDPAYLEKWKAITDYARERDIIVSGYELMVASRSRGQQNDVVDPATGRPGSPFGQSLCLGTQWADDYFERVWTFYDTTGFGGLTPDGPYHGCPCGSHDHANHLGLEDSQWVQWAKQVEVFHEAQRRNLYAPAPDWYFLNGQASTGMGYREASANLPREQALLLYRQYIYDGTFFKAPPMGGMAIGLIPTYIDDPKSILEPLHDNLEWYELHLIQLIGSGGNPHFRANRLYDTPETRAMVEKWIGWFKRYRDIITSDMIHVRRPDGRDIDVMLHVNPWLEEKGLAIFFNPLNEPMTREVVLPLYYTGLTDTASVREQEGEPEAYTLDARGNIVLTVTLPPRGVTWYVIESQ
ncbi:MAG: LamG domain-containing protein [Phycisphaerales bacterium JB063]